MKIELNGEDISDKVEIIEVDIPKDEKLIPPVYQDIEIHGVIISESWKFRSLLNKYPDSRFTKKIKPILAYSNWMRLMKEVMYDKR